MHEGDPQADRGLLTASVNSHHHFDHIGNMALFPQTTDLIVGPGFRDEYMPGYPARKDAWILESDYQYVVDI